MSKEQENISFEGMPSPFGASISGELMDKNLAEFLFEMSTLEDIRQAVRKTNLDPSYLHSILKRSIPGHLNCNSAIVVLFKRIVARYLKHNVAIHQAAETFFPDEFSEMRRSIIGAMEAERTLERANKMKD